MFCPNCGKEIKDNSKFCRYCGAAIDNTDDTNNHFDHIPKQNYNYSNEYTMQIKKKKNKFIIPIIIFSIVVFILIIPILSFFIFSNGIQKATNIVNDNNLYVEVKTVEEDTTEITSIIKETTTEIISEEAFNPNAENLNLNIQQVDSQNFPNVVIYANIENQNNITIKGLTQNNFILFETDNNGNKTPIPIDKLHQVDSNDKINLSLVLDNSGSMYDTGYSNNIDKMTQAKQAAINFLKQVRFDKDYKVSITSFDDFVYLLHDFSGNLTSLSNSVNQINTETYGLTALYDAIYSSILNTYPQSGAKCVIAFTDGMENRSNYTFDDVVNLSQHTGIPVYIIGIGEEPDSDLLSSLAENCSGEYFYVDVDNLSNLLEKIYLDIYNNQEELYVIEYTSPLKDNPSHKREITFTAKGSEGYNGKVEKTYVPTPSLNDDFGDYKDDDFIIDNSDNVKINESDLANLSLAQLRIARNEIFARYGRLFSDSMLNKWFYSKKWYLEIDEKFYPQDFNKQLSEIELLNIELIKKYENIILSSNEIYTNSESVLLTEYDLYISKDNLKTALSQMNENPNKTNTLNENIKMVEQAINRDDITY